MNLKILNTLEDMFKTSPQILRDDHKLRQSIQGMFNVWVEDVKVAFLTKVRIHSGGGEYFAPGALPKGLWNGS